MLTEPVGTPTVFLFCPTSAINQTPAAVYTLSERGLVLASGEHAPCRTH
jgi:hypothetical protein